MTQAAEGIERPKYSVPPVTEAALAIEYAPIQGLDLFGLVQLQSKWAANYPTQRDASEFQDSSALKVEVGRQSLRLWSESPDSVFVVQSQNDRLILNWRRVNPEIAYPGYEALRDEYSKLWAAQSSFMSHRELPQPEPMVGEFTFVNTIATGSHNVDQFIKLVATPEPETPGNRETVRFQTVHRVLSRDGNPFEGIIEVAGQPIGGPGANEFMLICTTKLLLGNGASLESALDEAHRLSSLTFDSMVTDQAKVLWGRL